MNKIIITGRPVKDPEIMYYEAENGKNTMAKFRFAVQKAHPKGDKTADFFNCVAFGRLAETVEKYVRQGRKLLLTGRMENNDYEINSKPEIITKVYGYNIIIESIEFQEKKEDTNHLVKDKNEYMSIPDELIDEMPFQ